MTKICPLSMANEPTDCYEEDCMAWNKGECAYYTSIPLSMFFIAQNTRNMAEELNDD